jgi:tRNA-splicing ligase RtcB (3'-phosphate/5'-hydroxy nucleic acid ligase)
MLSGKVLKANGWPEGKIIGYAKSAAAALEAQGLEQADVLSRLAEVRAEPARFLEDGLMGALARECQRRAQAEAKPPADELRDQPLEYRVWGQDQIDAGALSQMRNALRLPVAVAGALMPDAHVGYGLPIGGVLATHDAVIPYAVGVDIGCRMRLSVYEVAPGVLDQRPEAFQKTLLERTRFA